MKAATLALILLAAPAGAWEFSASPVCTIREDWAGGSAEVTYDPREAQSYAIALTREAGWGEAPVFGIVFEGARPLTITTDRQTLSDGGQTLTVRDRGFGNVLSGLEASDGATALFGEAALPIPLGGAAEAVARFRACVAGGIA